MAIVIMSATAFAGCFGAPPPTPQNLKPFATATLGKSVVLTGEAVTFTGQASDPDQGDSLKSWRWDWGDGSNTTGTNLSSTTHTYTTHGTYYVNLNVSDTHDATYDTIGTPLRVDVLVNFPDTKDNREPVANLFLWSDTAVIRPATSLNWGAQSSRGSWNASYKTLPVIVTYAMDYGDGSAVESHDNVSFESASWNGNFTHVYNTGGKFVAKLTVTTNETKKDSVMWTVIVISTAPTPGLKNPTTFTELTFGQPNNLDPAVAYDSASGEVIQQVYETLITYNGASADQFVPLLVTEIPTVANGGISADGLTYTFHLKQGVKFHSGDTMDADDVVYSFQRVLRIAWPAGPAWILSQTLNTTGIVAVNSTTVAFHLMRPYGPFISTLAYTVACIVSKQTVEAHGGIVDGERNQYMLRNMDGTGPFTFKSWTSGQQVVLVRNDAYHRTPARLEAVIIRFVNEFSTRMLELKSGNADSIAVNTADQQAAKDAAADANNKVEILKGASTWSILTGAFNLAINTTHPDREAADNVPSDFFMDPKMREAFVKAFNYDSFITNTVKGNGFRMTGIIPKGMYGYDATLSAGNFNMVEAAAAYNASAWVAANGYGNGFTLTIAYNTGNTNRQQACLLLKQGMEAIDPSITINVKDYAFDVYLDLVFTPTGIPGPIGLFFIGWGPDYADPDDYIVPFAKTGNQYPLYTGFSNASLDALINQAGSTPNSPARLALYDQIQHSINDNYIYIQVYEATNFRVQKTWVEGWYYNPMQQPDYYSMYKA